MKMFNDDHLINLLNKINEMKFEDYHSPNLNILPMILLSSELSYNQIIIKKII